MFEKLKELIDTKFDGRGVLIFHRSGLVTFISDCRILAPIKEPRNFVLDIGSNKNLIAKEVTIETLIKELEAV